MQQTPVRVILVDDEEIVRYGFKIVSRAAEEIDVVGEACNGEEALTKVQELKPDVVLMDVGMPRMDGITATREIMRIHPAAKVLILTTHDDDALLVEALQQGAVGYLLKNLPPEDFVEAIKATHKGYMQFDARLADKLRRQLQPPALQKQPQAVFRAQRDKLADITPREQEVLQLVAQGASNREIAETLNITEKTVKNHVSRILSLVGLRDRTQLAIWVNNPQADTSFFSVA